MRGTYGQLRAPILAMISTAIICPESVLGRESTRPRNHHLTLLYFTQAVTDLPPTRAASQARKKPRDQSEPIQNISHILQPPTTYQNGTYCEPQTEVFVVFGLDAVNPGVSSYLSACLSAVQEAINTGKTGPIPDGGWRGPLGHNALSMVVWSEDTYQTTWLELYLAIQALIGWMSSEGHTFGTGGFQIWDGEHKVGHGSIARAAAIRRMSPYILQRALDSQVHSPTVPEV